MKIIKTKEDFKGKYIKLPKNLSKKKWDKIENKFERIGSFTGHLNFDNIDEFPYIYFDGTSIGTWTKESFLAEMKNPIEISIKDFLKEEVVYTGYNCIPSKYLVFYGTDLNEIKEDVERSIQGFSYGKPKEFYNIIQALNWCFINPMKEITYETPYSRNSRTRYNEEKDSFENYNQELKIWTCNSYYRTSSPSLWRNIREYRPTKIPVYETHRCEKIKAHMDFGTGKIYLPSEEKSNNDFITDIGNLFFEYNFDESFKKHLKEQRLLEEKAKKYDEMVEIMESENE